LLRMKALLVLNVLKEKQDILTLLLMRPRFTNYEAYALAVTC